MASTKELKAALLRAARQQQFLEVVGRDEAEQRFREHLRLAPLGEERLGLAQALGRVLAREIVSGVDVPGFDRSNVDGFAVRAADTAGASDDCPRLLRLNAEVLTPGVESAEAVAEGTATILATGGMVPRGADAVLMVEYTDVLEEHGELQIEVHRAVAPGEAIASAAGDIARGEMVVRAGQVLTSREIGVLAAVGLAEVWVWRKPRVAIFSTGDELIASGSIGTGEAARPGAVFDSNGAILAAAVEELGGIPVPLGIARDEETSLTALLRKALESDMVLLSGGTSKGAGDLAARVVGRLKNPGIVVHGVALKPGKPICLAVTDGKPVVILPGFPTSAIFTFHEFVAPVIRAFAGLPAERRESVRATLPLRIGSERGRTEYVLVSLVEREGGGLEGTRSGASGNAALPPAGAQAGIAALPAAGAQAGIAALPAAGAQAGNAAQPAAGARLAAYPISKGSGSVTTFGHADGFFAIGAQAEMLPEGAEVEVSIIGARHKVADLVIIGSHCAGLEVLIGKLIGEGLAVRSLNLGSTGGLAAVKRGECDIAGIHLMDPVTGEYNRPFVTEGLELIAGYGRLQGIVFRPGDVRFEGRTAEAAIADVVADSGCLMVNRNAGSGTRIVIDRLLKGARPAGYSKQAKTHNGVAVAVAQSVADWGVAIGTVARQYGLGFLPLQAEQYDFVVPRNRLHRAPVQRFLQLLREPSIRGELEDLGFHL